MEGVEMIAEQKTRLVLLSRGSYRLSDEELRLANLHNELRIRVPLLYVDVAEAWRIEIEGDVRYYGHVYFDTEKLRFVMRWERRQ
jgi:hypothetical protein